MPAQLFWWYNTASWYHTVSCNWAGSMFWVLVRIYSDGCTNLHRILMALVHASQSFYLASSLLLGCSIVEHKRSGCVNLGREGLYKACLSSIENGKDVSIELYACECIYNMHWAGSMKYLYNMSNSNELHNTVVDCVAQLSHLNIFHDKWLPLETLPCSIWFNHWRLEVFTLDALQSPPRHNS